jgi:hypothetical protein
MRDLERSLSELGPSVARSFKPVLDDLAAKQAALAAQNVQILALIGAQVAGDGGNASWGPAMLTTSYVTYATVTVAVPAGYSVAKVLGVSSVLVSIAGSNTFNLRTVIQGTPGNAMTAAGGNAGITHFVTLTGLSGGTITVGTDVSVSPSPITGIVVTSANIVFLR